LDPRDQLLTQIKQSVTFLKENTDVKPLVGMILGSGLSGVAGEFEKLIRIPYSDIPNFPEATIEGHEGVLTVGNKGGVGVAAFQGRFHCYEGYTMWGVTLPIRVLAYLGCKYVIITNGAGGLNENMEAGSLMIIKDHINLMSANPLTGLNVEELGPIFVDMVEAYDPGLRFVAMDAASSLGLEVTEGVYCAVPGPSYETPAEINFLRKIGANAVGMSTVPEVIVARQQGLKVLGISVITNNAFKQNNISHKEVLAQASRVSAQLEELLENIIKEIGEKKNEL
jgi:purine-nucleoside phosphorylase